MSDNALTMFQPGQLPAHIAAFFGSEEGSNIENRSTVNSLSPQGKQWTISLNGDKTTLMRVQDGDQVPVAVMKVVVLDFAKRRGRAYYEGAYDPNKEAAPICWSDDGIAPPDDVLKKQSEKCETCPMAAKGSKIGDNGKALTACSQHRMLAVVPANKLDFPPLRLKIAITSDWDKQSPDAEAAGWYGFQNYLDFLKSRGASHTAAIVTKMKFDANAAYPKIFFSTDRWLTPEELAQAIPLSKTEEVQQLLGGTYTPAGVDGVRRDETTAAVNQPQTPTQAAAAANVQEGAPAEESPAEKMLREAAALVEAERAKKAAAAGAGAATTAAPNAAAAATVVADDDDGEIIIPNAATTQPAAAAQPAATPTPTAAPAQATAKVDPALAALLDDWGD